MKMCRDQDQTQDFRFSPERRLRNRKEFDRIFQKNSYKAGNHAFLLLADLNSHSHARLGLIVPKKHLKRAVDRNWVKRMARESFRKCQFQLENLDIVLLCRPGVSKVVLEKNLHQQLDRLFYQLKSS